MIYNYTNTNYSIIMDLTKLTKSELLLQCQTQGIKSYKSKSKDGLIKLLEEIIGTLPSYDEIVPLGGKRSETAGRVELKRSTLKITLKTSSKLLQ